MKFDNKQALPTRSAKNVLGGKLEECGRDPLTGFFRDGCCHTVTEDWGSHTLCARMTTEFLAFSKLRGNDLTTARPEDAFHGLREGDMWCLCVSRWKEAYEFGVAPCVRLAATHERALETVTIEMLMRRATDFN